MCPKTEDEVFPFFLFILSFGFFFLAFAALWPRETATREFLKPSISMMMGLVRQMSLESTSKGAALALGPEQREAERNFLPTRVKGRSAAASQRGGEKKAMLGCAANERRKKMINKFVGNEDS